MAKRQAPITIKGLHKVFKQLPKDVSTRLRAASKQIASKVSGKAQTKARSLGGQAALVASSIKAGSDRVPVIKAGGSKKLPTHSDGRVRIGAKQTVGHVLFGVNFGSKKYRQFPPVTRPDRFIYATIRDDSQQIHEEYSEALNEALKDIKTNGVRR